MSDIRAWDTEDGKNKSVTLTKTETGAYQKRALDIILYGKKEDGTFTPVAVTNEGYVKNDITDATVVAEFTPGSLVKLLDKNGTNQLVIDSDGKIPVTFTPTGAFQPATAANQRIVASTGEYTESDLSGNDLTITSSKGIWIKNDGTSDLTITINSMTFTVKPGEAGPLEFANAFTTVTFSTSPTFRLWGITRSA
jgi:hypothetical protein